MAELRESGVEPLALVGLLARLGSSLPVEVIADPAELVRTFDLARFGLAPTRLDPAELRLHAAKTLRALPYAAVADRLRGMGVPDEVAPRFWAAVGPNLDRLDEAAGWWALCRDGTAPAVDDEDRALSPRRWRCCRRRPWDEGTWAAWTAAVRDRTGRKGRALFRPLRRALTGRDTGPEMAALMPLLQGP